MAEHVDITVSVIDQATEKLKGIKAGFETSMGAAAAATKAVAGALLATGAAVGAFATASVLKYSEVGDAVEKMASRTGLAAEAVSALRVAADASGTSIGSVETGIKMMQKAMVFAEDGAYELAGAMKKFGITVFEDFPTMTVAEQFEYLGQQIGKIEDPAARTQAAMEAFGKSGADLIPLFEDGAFSMDEWSKKAKELGVSFDDLSAKQAAELNDRIGEMKTAMVGAQLAIANLIAPAVIDFLQFKLVPAIQMVTAWIGKYLPIGIEYAKKLWQDLQPTLADAISIMQVVTDKVKQILSWLEKSGIVEAFRMKFEAMYQTFTERILPTLIKLYPAFEAIAKVVGVILVGAILGLVALLELLIRAFAKVMETIDTVVVAFRNLGTNLGVSLADISNGIQRVIDLWNRMVTLVTTPVKAAGTAWSNLGANLGLGAPKAAGGSVKSGMAYPVGEQGPELFIPGRSGTIIPNGGFSMGQSSGKTIIININNPHVFDTDDIVTKLGDPIIQVLKQHSAVA